jgi:uncharacterized protein (DUF983 family)
MSHRQAYLAGTKDGILGGAFVVVGFVVLVVVTAVDVSLVSVVTPTWIVLIVVLCLADHLQMVSFNTDLGDCSSQR